MISTTVWPRSWNSRSFCSTTVKPRWMSGAVGSIPSLTRSGRPCGELALELARRAGSRPRSGPATRPSSRAASGVGSSESIRANARLSPPLGTAARCRPGRRGSGRVAVTAAMAGCRRGSTTIDRMSDDARHHHAGRRPARAPIPFAPSAPALAARPASGRRAKPRVRKLRLLLDPGRPRRAGAHLDRVRDDDGGRLRPARSSRTASSTSTRPNSYLYDDHWRPIGIFAPPNHVVIDTYEQISPAMQRRDHRGRGQALLDRPGRRHPRHRAARSSPTSPAAPPRAPRRSPSSSSRTRSPSRTTGRSSRSCARRRSPTT